MRVTRIKESLCIHDFPDVDIHAGPGNYCVACRGEVATFGDYIVTLPDGTNHLVSVDVHDAIIAAYKESVSVRQR